MRDYRNFDKWITDIQNDVYPQPADVYHQWWGDLIINAWLYPLSGTVTVLDVGCGQGQFEPTFRALGKKWTGVTLGTDYDICKNAGLDVYKEDMSFLHFDDNSFDIIFARHVLEHSAFPLLTLMEWRRVSKEYMILVLPNPDHFQYFGKNHYSVMSNSHILWLAARAGWRAIVKNYMEKQELRYLFVKAEPRTELMWESEGDLEREYGSHR